MSGKADIVVNAAKNESNGEGKASEPSAKSKLTGREIKIIIGGLVVLMTSVIILTIFLRNNSDEAVIATPPIAGGNMVVNEANVEEITRAVSERVAKGMFETHMTTTWTFPDGHSPSVDAVMGNSPNNNYPFWFTVALTGTGEVIYTSGLLPLGTQLTEITLDTPLPMGEHRAVVSINMIDEDGASVENNVGLGITIVILN